jgi:hypothetical protein
MQRFKTSQNLDTYAVKIQKYFRVAIASGKKRRQQNFDGG